MINGEVLQKSHRFSINVFVSGGFAMAEKIKLELDPAVPVLDAEALPALSPSSLPTAAPAGEEKEAPKYMEDVNLSEEEQQMVDEFASKIDLSNTNVVLQYGAASQKKIADFSDSALEGVRTKDLGEVGNAIASLVAELKGFQVGEEEKKGIAGWFKKKGNKLAQIKARYDSADKNVDKITGVLMDHQNQLTTDIVMLDKMYESNLTYFKELTMYIIAGKKALEREQATTLAELQEKAKETGLAEDAQAANDYAALCDRFDKKLYDLELTRTISMQMAPQIRLIQNSDTLMVEKIQSTLNNTIPLWKNQMVLALGILHSEEAMKAQREVNNLTNELIKKNAEKLHQGATAIAAESERGIIDIDTVMHANEELITSLDEVIQIQEEGRVKRREAEAQLGQVEAELKQKLLDIRSAQLDAPADNTQ